MWLQNFFSMLEYVVLIFYFELVIIILITNIFKNQTHKHTYTQINSKKKLFLKLFWSTI